MSALREERASLPAIGEDTKTQADMSALLDALRNSNSSLPASVQHNLDMLLPRIPIRPVVRRRFNSSDPILRSSYARSSSSSFGDSPIDLRRAVLSRSAAAASVTGANGDPEVTQLRRLRALRRTLSETHARLVPLDSLTQLDARPDVGSHDGNRDTVDDYDEQLQQQWSYSHSKSHRSSDDVSSSSSASSLSSLYSSPATTPQSQSQSHSHSYSHSRHSLSFATDSDCGASTSNSASASVEKLRNLQKLFQEGFITVTEYKDRRLQLVGEIGTIERTIAKATDLILTTDLPIVYHAPPDFTLLRERDAIKHVFDSEQRKWTSCPIKVKLDTRPFARGGLRQVFHMQDLSDGHHSSYVAKVAMNPNENPDTYFRDVEMQAVAAKFAKLYNSYHPPRRVEFLAAWILQLLPTGNTDHTGTNTGIDATLSGSICGVEPFIAGEYRKHNNNCGFVSSDFERSTPQAFSHFTFEASGHQILVVDIQGVGDHYTDPQIHTRRGEEFGKGNLAARGFERFLATHRCNLICRYLKLPLHNPRDADDVVLLGGGSHTGSQNDMGHSIIHSSDGAGAVVDPKGTVPAQPFMNQPRVRVDRVDSELCHYYSDSSAFKSYKAKRALQNQQARDSARTGTGVSIGTSVGSGGVNTGSSRMAHFVEAMQTQPNCSAWCGVGGINSGSGACRIS